SNVCVPCSTAIGPAVEPTRLPFSKTFRSTGADTLTPPNPPAAAAGAALSVVAGSRLGSFGAGVVAAPFRPAPAPAAAVVPPAAVVAPVAGEVAGASGAGAAVGGTAADGAGSGLNGGGAGIEAVRGGGDVVVVLSDGVLAPENMPDANIAPAATTATAAPMATHMPVPGFFGRGDATEITGIGFAGVCMSSFCNSIFIGSAESFLSALPSLPDLLSSLADPSPFVFAGVASVGRNAR